MIIEIALRGVGFELGREYGMYQLFRGGLTIAAGYGNKGYAKLLSMILSQLLQGLQDIVYNDSSFIYIVSGVINDHRSGSGTDRLRGKCITIEAIAFECKEKITGLQLAGIGLYTGVL
jgi:hypothetical protein